MAPREGEPYLVFTSFFGGTFRLYRMPIRQPEARIDAAEAAAPATEAEPFEPPLHLTIDAAKVAPYKLHWDVDAPGISVGVADDGTFLSNVNVQFSDLLGDHRFQIVASSVSSFSNTSATYLNLRRRVAWGATLFDYRDFFLRTTSTFGSTADTDQIQRSTGAMFFVQYPFSRYYRVEGAVGYLDRSQDLVTGVDFFGFPTFTAISDRYALAQTSITGDTTRFQSFGPFQGKRFNVGATYGHNLGSDGGGIIADQALEGNILEYNVDFRLYRQLTRRSLIAWRVSGVYNAGDRETFYGFGGINQLRGFDFRDFFGSRLAWSNFELRFPLVDEMRFPFFGLRSIRGFLFTDVGAAWLKDDLWYDPETQVFRVDPTTGENTIPFKFWDSDNNRFQDARGSYGYGFQFFFIGGLQLNWSWAKRLPYTRYVLDPTGTALLPIKADTGGMQMNFYIIYDF
jgi:hypothetical protein